jgi:hypothetical protein
MKNISYKTLEKIQNEHFTFNNVHFFENCVGYEITWENMVEPDQATDDAAIRRTHFVYWITNATDACSQYVILIAFLRQQWLRERASVLCLCVHCLFFMS